MTDVRTSDVLAKWASLKLATRYLFIDADLEQLIILKRFCAEHQSMVIFWEISYCRAIVVCQSYTVTASLMKHVDHLLFTDRLYISKPYIAFSFPLSFYLLLTNAFLHRLLCVCVTRFLSLFLSLCTVMNDVTITTV